jgi:hypothetical protein
MRRERTVVQYRQVACSAAHVPVQSFEPGGHAAIERFKPK